MNPRSARSAAAGDRLEIVPPPPDPHQLHGVMECLFCGDRREVPEMSLHELHVMLRAQSYQGKLTEAGDAIAAICPTCSVGDCPDCGQPVAEHQDEDGMVLCCDGTRR